MSIEHDGYTFAGVTYHQVPDILDWDYQDVRVKFFGVAGEAEIRDAIGGRAILCEVDFCQFADFIDLQTFLTVLDTKINVLKGTLTISTVTFANCTFKGFSRIERPFYDGSGVNGWVQRGTLAWRQLSIA